MDYLDPSLSIISLNCSGVRIVLRRALISVSSSWFKLGKRASSSFFAFNTASLNFTIASSIEACSLVFCSSLILIDEAILCVMSFAFLTCWSCNCSLLLLAGALLAICACVKINKQISVMQRHAFVKLVFMTLSFDGVDNTLIAR